MTEAERQFIGTLTTPAKIQEFLDELPYSKELTYRCPLRVLRERMAHCFDGALFGAAMLRLLGHPPLILEMVPNERDDDHLLALYRCDGHWGAVSKSNFVGLRFRDPVYRTLRELVMSYFDQFYNVDREKTLRGYTLPLNLKTFDPWDWMASDGCLEGIAKKLDRIRKVPVLTQPMIGYLSPVDERSYRAGLLGADEAGLYKPVGEKDNCLGLDFYDRHTKPEADLETHARQMERWHPIEKKKPTKKRTKPSTRRKGVRRSR